jgi:hypothetical protein
MGDEWAFVKVVLINMGVGRYWPPTPFTLYVDILEPRNILCASGISGGLANTIATTLPLLYASMSNCLNSLDAGSLGGSSITLSSLLLVLKHIE